MTRVCGARLEIAGRKFHCTEMVDHKGPHRMVRGKWLIHKWDTPQWGQNENRKTMTCTHSNKFWAGISSVCERCGAQRTTKGTKPQEEVEHDEFRPFSDLDDEMSQ